MNKDSRYLSSKGRAFIIKDEDKRDFIDIIEEDLDTSVVDYGEGYFVVNDDSDNESDEVFMLNKL